MKTSKKYDVDAIVAGYRSGMSLRTLGTVHSVSHQSVRNILARSGLDSLDGGGAIGALKNIRSKVDSAKENEIRIEARSRKYWGMSAAEFDAHVAEYGGRNTPGAPMLAYITHRQNANRRGIQWKFTFAEWWKVWVESGKWEQRGRHAGEFVMARYGDKDTPYATETVYICTATENLKDGFVTLPYNERKTPKNRLS